MEQKVVQPLEHAGAYVQLSRRIGNPAELILSIDDRFPVGAQQSLDIAGENTDQLPQAFPIALKLATVQSHLRRAKHRFQPLSGEVSQTAEVSQRVRKCV